MRTAKRKTNLKNENSLKDLWNNIMHTSICIIGVPEREEREKAVENYLMKLWLKTS